MARTLPAQMAEAVAVFEAIAAEPEPWALSPADRERLQQLLVSLDRRLRDDGSPDKPRLLVHDDVRWFEVRGSERVSLQRRGPVRLLFKALVDQHRKDPGRATTLEALFAAGWPGQSVSHESGAARVYVALATLRRLGLRPLLQTRDDGYLLDPAAAVEVTAN